MLFSSIPGLQETKQRLIQAINNNHLAHALLFHGPEGAANLKMALALAAYVNCEDKGPEDACGVCSSCQKMAKLVHPDLSFTFPLPGNLIKEDDDKNKKVDVLAPWREFVLTRPYSNLQDWIYHNGFEKKQLNISKAAAKQIIQTVSLKSFEGGYKMILVWMPEYMHTAAANALLKVLEEPPEKTLFLMVAHQPEQLLTTILSRTQKVLVRAFSDEEVKDHLINEGLCSREGALQVAPLANGNMREAYRLVDQVIDENTSKFRDWMRICFTLDINNIMALAEGFQGADKEGQKALFLTGLNILRESLLKRSQLEELMRTAPADREFVENFSLKALTEEKILNIYRLLNAAHYHLERNANAKILFADLSFDMAKVLRKKETA
ncbi:DNA polymerase III subunit [Echinicola rosea]|uniref:DNA polymerase III subunit delta n=1 Tax=Echinicola rosea TaxID=1807691 RepID=A0ABQ1UPX1_9BACT|nr:DNA polymerase III subunit delta' [Echinicola rosea]GGF23909.1 DNA polymerase III subunit delta [Echinicola rosea]